MRTKLRDRNPNFLTLGLSPFFSWLVKINAESMYMPAKIKKNSAIFGMGDLS